MMRYLLFLTSWLGFALLLFTLALGLESLDRRFNKETVEPGKERYPFPVVVVTPSSGRQGWVVFLNRLPNFLEEHPDYTFLVPEGLEVKYGRRNGKVDVLKRLSGGSQYLEVSAIWVDSRVYGWYEASDKQIQPRFIYDDYPWRTGRFMTPVLALVPAIWVSKHKRGKKGPITGLTA